MRNRNGVEKKVKASAMRLHLLPVFRDQHMMRAELFRILALFRRRGDHRHLGAERIGELDAHMPKTAEPDNTDLIALADLPVRQRRPGGDARAEQRRHGARVEIFRNAQHKLVAHDDMF